MTALGISHTGSRVVMSLLLVGLFGISVHAADVPMFLQLTEPASGPQMIEHPVLVRTDTIIATKERYAHD